MKTAPDSPLPVLLELNNISTAILDLMSRRADELPSRAPSANSLVWLSIIFTKDVAGARLGWGWPSQLTNDQSDFFPGHPSFNYCGERGWTRGIRYFSLLVRPTIPWAARESSIKPEKWIVRNTSWRLPLFNNELPKMSSDFTNWNANNAEWHRAQYIRPGRWLWWIRPILQSI